MKLQRSRSVSQHSSSSSAKSMLNPQDLLGDQMRTQMDYSKHELPQLDSYPEIRPLQPAQMQSCLCDCFIEKLDLQARLRISESDNHRLQSNLAEMDAEYEKTLEELRQDMLALLD